MLRFLTRVIHYVFPAIFVTSFFLFPAPQIASAQNPDCTSGMSSSDCIQGQGGQDLSSQATVSFSKYFSVTIKGGYTARGVGMRNTGSGKIVINDIPTGSSVYAAFLYWAIIGPSSMTGFNYGRGYINNAPITGTRVASSQSPCWNDPSGNFPPIWTYRANVKSLMVKGGNGTYQLSGFASGIKDGSDPWDTVHTLPMLEGASLVIIYSNSGLPNTSFRIYNGAASGGFGDNISVPDLHLNIAGVNAVIPTGFSYTTFIGSGSRDIPSRTSFYAEDFGPEIGFKGGDPNGRLDEFGEPSSYKYGNLWDTINVDLTKIIHPPETDFVFTSTPSESCFTWVAQVFSYSNGNQDTDGDKLLDGWEINGYDANGTGLVDLPRMGAKWNHKDLFIEVDYMNAQDNSSGADYALPGLAELDDLVAAFANAPVKNPDGIDGITLHIDTGGAAYGINPNEDGSGARFNLGGGRKIDFQSELGTADALCKTYNWSQFQALKTANFDPKRTPIFHYAIFAHNLAPCMTSASGISRNSTSSDAYFIKGGTDFIVSLGSWPNQGSPTEREGTFMHMLGHSLGLRHGGNDQLNYKPNYLSVMNYFYQMDGVYRNGGWAYDYSRALLPSLPETSLNEVKGLGPLAANYYTRYFCPGLIAVPAVPPAVRWSASVATNNIDWNCDGDATDITGVKVDLNWDKLPALLYTYTTLGSQNNWASLNFTGNGVIGSNSSLSTIISRSNSVITTTNVTELTYERNLQILGDLPRVGPTP